MRVAVVDIGTNSTRLLIAEVEDGRVVSEPERHSEVTRLGMGVDSNGALASLVDDVHAIFQTNVPDDQRRAVKDAIAVAGTATSLAAIAQEVEPYDPSKVEGYVLARSEIERLLDRLAAIPLEERRQ